MLNVVLNKCTVYQSRSSLADAYLVQLVCVIGPLSHLRLGSSTWGLFVEERRAVFCGKSQRLREESQQESRWTSSPPMILERWSMNLYYTGRVPKIEGLYRTCTLCMIVVLLVVIVIVVVVAIELMGPSGSKGRGFKVPPVFNVRARVTRFPFAQSTGKLTLVWRCNLSPSRHEGDSICCLL